MSPGDLVWLWAGRVLVALLCLLWAGALGLAVLEGPQAHQRRRKP